MAPATPTESSPMAPVEPGKLDFVAKFEKLQGAKKITATACIISTYIIVSATMIQTNSWLMKNDHFPYPPVLAMLHMFSSFFGTLAMYGVCPSLFTAMPTLVIDRWFLLKFVPLAGCFASSMILSNMSYMYISVAFIQMLKEANIGLCYVFSLATGLEKGTKTASILLSLVFLFTLVAAKGEIHFVLMGVFIQLGSQCFECSKIVMQNLLMSNKNGPATKLDPLTTVLFMAPTCFVFSVFLYLPKMAEMPPSLVLSHAMACWPQLLISCVIAIFLNVLICITIATIQGVGFVLIGVVKDITIVCVSAALMGEVITPMQAIGFSSALVCVVLYSTYKMNKQHFEEDDLVKGFTSIIDENFVNKGKKMLP